MRDVFLELVRRPIVVVVDEADEIALGPRDPGVAGPARPRVALTEYLDAGVTDGLDQVRAVVRAAVVDDEELDVRVGLIEDRLECVADEALRVVERRDDGYEFHASRQVLSTCCVVHRSRTRQALHTSSGYDDTASLGGFLQGKRL